MGKFFKTGRRIITLALSAALIFGEASVSLAAPKINMDTAIEVAEGSEVVGAYTPGKVTNVGFNTYSSPGVINKNRLSWDHIQGATRYQIRITDAQGNDYVDSLINYDSGVYKEIQYANTKNSYFSITTNFRKIESKSGGYVYSEVDGVYVYMKPGTAYKLQVRAVRVHDSDTTYGPWSDAVSYTTETYTLTKPANVRVVEENDGDHYVLFDNDCYTEAEIKDSDGNYYYYNVEDVDGKTQYTYYDLSNSTYFSIYNTLYAYIYEKTGSGWERKKDAEGYYIRPFEVNKTYTIRLRGYGTGVDGKRKVSEWSNAVTFKVPKNAAPPKTGNLDFDYKSHSVTWNRIPSASGYYIEVKDKNGNLYGNSSGPIRRGSNYSNSIDLDDIYQIKKNADNTYSLVYDSDSNTIPANKPGMTYTVRVQCFNYSNTDDEEQLSAWSESISCDIPNNEYATVSKVTGIRYYYSNSTNRGIAWNEPVDKSGMTDITYDIEIKDSKGRFYKVLDGTNLVDVSTTNTYYYTNSLNTYANLDGVYEPVINADGDNVTAFTKGETYTVRVKMNAQVMKADGSGYEAKSAPWSDPYTFKVPGDTTEEGYQGKPATVTGLLVKSTPDTDNDFLMSPVLYWNKLDNVSRYEVEIKDADGNVFSNSAYEQDGKLYYTYYTTTSYSMDFSNAKSLVSYSIKSGQPVSLLRDSNNAVVHPFIAGKTYTFRVRAVNSYSKKNADGSWTDTVVTPGDWSSAISFTMPNYDLKVTGLKYVRADDDYYYFAYNAGDAYSTLYYQVASESSFGDGSIVIDWDDDLAYVDPKTETEYDLAIPKDALEPSKTYYVRVVNSKYGDPSGNNIDKKAMNAILSTAATTSFTTEAKKTNKAKKITGLNCYNENSDTFYFRFDPVLSAEDDDYYEVQISSSNSADASKWSVFSKDNIGTTFSISRNKLPDGVTYVRVVAYYNDTNEKTGKTKKVYGEASNVVSVNVVRETTSSIGVISLDRESDDYYYFTFTGSPRLNERVYYYIADTSTFDTNNKEGSYYKSYDTSNKASINNKTITFSKKNLKPGKTYYIKMRVYNSNAKTTASRYSSYSNVLSFTTSVPKVIINGTVVGKTSVQIRMKEDGIPSGWVTGYEFQRRNVSGKKTTWKTLIKTSSNTYTNKKLKAFKTYTYRVRPYYFDKFTKKYTYGDWDYTEAMTGWPGSINVKATAASKTSIKLSWNKVKGAQGYEVYRCVADSKKSKVSNGNSNSYSAYQLIKTLKSGKKSYTDKKLVNGMDYDYMVKAYKKVGKKKVYITGSASCTLGFELVEISSVYNSNGSLKLTWNPVLSGKGYKIEKYDNYKNTWTLIKTIKKAKTSNYTFPKAVDVNNGDVYRIYAFNGKKVTNDIKVNVYPMLAAPTNVKAKVSGKKIIVTWNKVSGADYYRVYRTTDPSEIYDADEKSYSHNSGELLAVYVPDESSFTGFRMLTEDEMDINSVTDQQIAITYNGVPNQVFYKGPQSGVKYYYYVVAYKKYKEYGYSAENSEADVYYSGESKAASAMIVEAKPGKAAISKGTSKKKTVTLTIKGSAKADGYEIERSKKQKKGYTVIGETTTTSYKDKYNKKKNKIKGTYYYRVRAFVYNDDGTKVYSAYSKAKKVKVK